MAELITEYENSQPTISVITVVKNDRPGLAKTIQSVVSQTYPNLNYVIVDGASTDGTIELIQDFAQQYPQIIQHWISEPDSGISEAFNKGIQASSGDWLNFLNAGDTFQNSQTLKAIAPYLTSPSVPSKIITGFSQFRQNTIPEQRISHQAPLHQRAKISHQASFIHRDIFQQIGLFNSAYQIRMDYEFWLRVLPQYDFLMIDEILVNYDGDGLSSRGDFTKLFYGEEKRANQEQHIENYQSLNRRLNFIYVKDRLGRLLRGL